MNSADDPVHDFASFVVAASGDLPDEIERFRPRPWQLRFWGEVEEGAAPKIVMRRGGRGLASLPRKR
jgi:hypothetical protein